MIRKGLRESLEEFTARTGLDRADARRLWRSEGAVCLGGTCDEVRAASERDTLCLIPVFVPAPHGAVVSYYRGELIDYEAYVPSLRGDE